MNRFYVQRQDYSRETSFFLVGKDTIAQHVDFTMEPVSDPGLVSDSTFALPTEMAEQLFQEMWDQGFRPAGEIVSDKTLSAQSRHIDFAEMVATKLLARGLSK